MNIWVLINIIVLLAGGSIWVLINIFVLLAGGGLFYWAYHIDQRGSEQYGCILPGVCGALLLIGGGISSVIKLVWF